MPSARDSWIAVFAFVVLYAAGAARTVQGGDAGEFMTVAATGGVAHPPGYPLYTALTSLLAGLVPFGSIPWKVSLGSALCGGAAVGAIHRAVARVTEHRGAAWAAAVAMGCAPLMWKWSGVAEVLSGAVLTAALLVLAAARTHTGERGPSQAAWLGLAFATGIANHHTAILFAPLVAYAGLGALPRPLRWSSGLATFTTFVLVALGAGLLPYALLLGDGGGWRWGATNDGGLVHHFFRSDYGTFTASERSEGEGLWAWPLKYVLGIAERFWAAAFLALLGFVLLVRRSAGFAAGVLGSWLLAGPWFLTKFDLATSGYTRVVIERFHPVPDVLVALCVGLGVPWVLTRRVWSDGRLPAALLTVALGGAALTSAPRAHWLGWTVLDDYLRDVFDHVEPDAVVFTHGDSMFFGGTYLQEAEGLAPGVAWVNPALLGYSWYRERLRRRHPTLVLEADGRPLSTADVVRANRARPVYVAPRLVLQRPDIQAALNGVAPVYPVGSLLMKLASTTDRVPGPAGLEMEMTRAYAELRMRTVLVEADLDHELEGPVWENYAIPWMALAAGYEAQGDHQGAARADEVVRRLAPWLLGTE